MDKTPQTLREFVGQESIKRQLQAMLKVETPMNLLFRGEAGLGKTTLARLYASYRGDYSYQPIPSHLSGFGNQLKTHVIDEIHMVKDFEPLFNEMKYNTFVFCTTEAEDLPLTFVSRCATFVMSSYSEEELKQILHLAKEKNKIAIERTGLKIIASRSKGTPRIALHLLERLFILSSAENLTLTARTVSQLLSDLEVYENGLTKEDREYLDILSLVDTPVSLHTLSASLNRSKGFVTSGLEPYLLRQKYIMITARGRVLTEIGKTIVRG